MPRLNDAQREAILNQYHIGKSQYQLAKDFNVSPATINKMCKGIPPRLKDKVNEQVKVHRALGLESESQVKAFDKEVNDRIRHLALFNHSALENQRKANLAIDKIDDKKIDEKNLHSLEAHSRITQRNKETVLGKDKTVEISNTNAQQTHNNLTVSFGKS